MLATTQVNVTVLDINDNNPLFTDLPYVVAIEEEVTGPLLLLVVSAQDSDSGANGKITYILSGNSEKFSIITESVSV